MRFFISLIVATFALTGAAFADSSTDPFANFYGNTVSIENPAGTRVILIDDDGSYSQVRADGTTVEGTWAVDGDNTCFTQGDNPPYCVASVERHVGDTWEVTAPDGTKETATLVAGR